MYQLGRQAVVAFHTVARRADFAGEVESADDFDLHVGETGGPQPALPYQVIEVAREKAPAWRMPMSTVWIARMPLIAAAKFA